MGMDRPIVSPAQEAGFWGSKKKKVLIALALTALVVVCLIGIFAPTHSPPEVRPQNRVFFPYVPIEAAMDHSAKPCYDFYSYACGNWEYRAAEIMQSGYVTAFNILQNAIQQFTKELYSNAEVSGDFPKFLNNAITYYRNCMKSLNKKHDQKMDPTLKSFFDEIGGWPLLGSWKEMGYSWEKACSVIVRWIGTDTIISVQVGVDDTDSNRNILLVKAPQLQSLMKDDYNIKVILYSVIHTLSTALSDDRFYSEFEKMSSLEMKLAEFKHPKTDEDEKPQKMSVAHLQELVPGIDWLQMLQRMTNDTLGAEHCFTETSDVLVSDINYLREATDFLNAGKVSKRTIANLLGWFVVRELYPFLPGVLLKFSQHVGYTKEEKALLIKGICFEKGSDIFSDAVSYLYVKSTPNFDDQAGGELVSYLKDSFSSTIRSCKWLDEQTRSRIIDKMEAMFEVNGYPQLFSDKYKFDDNFVDFPAMTDSSVRNFLLSWKYFVRKNLLVLKMENTMSRWQIPRPVTYVGAYYVADRNAIVIPMAVQNPPFFYLGGPWYLNFGAIGSMIGHEINHGYDNIGRKRDKRGTLKDWWTSQSILAHDKQLACFEKQFGEYPIEGTEMLVNGTRTLSENVADSTGLEQAYLAYKQWEEVHGVEGRYPGLEHLTPDQMFFVAFASQYCAAISPSAKITLASVDSHSTPRVRILGSVSNSESFAKAFKCKIGSPMNPVRKCTMW